MDLIVVLIFTSFMINDHKGEIQMFYLNIFSCISWPFIYPFWENGYLFKSFVYFKIQLSFIIELLEILKNILWLLNPYQIYELEGCLGGLVG